MTKRMMLFIPGIKGSELWEGDNKRWFPKNLDDLESTSITKKLDPITALGSVNAYGHNKVIYDYILDRYPKEQFDIHPYDWRQSIYNSVDALVGTIKNYTENDEQLYLVAHSMGGMLAKLAILELERQGLSNRVTRLITVGTPWKGSPDAYKVLSYGEPGIFSSLFEFHELFDDKKTRLLARQFPSVYQLLPSEQYYFHGDNDTGKFISPIKEERYPSYDDVLQIVQSCYLDAAKTTGIHEDVYSIYMKRIQEDMVKQIPISIPHDCLIGCNYPTLYRLPAVNPKRRLKFKKECKFDDGDGVVPLYSALAPHTGENVKEYYVAGQHSDLLALDPVLQFINWCFNEKNGECPDYIYEEPIGNVFSRSLMAKIMCPVDTTILDADGKYVTGTYDPSVAGISELAYDKDTMFFNIGESKYVFLKNGLKDDLKFKINSYDSGVADVSVKVFSDEDVTELSFEPIPVNKHIGAELFVPIKSNINNSELRTDSKIQKPTFQKRIKSDIINEIPNVPIPSLTVKVVNAGDQKALYRQVFSGNVRIAIESDDPAHIHDIYFIINDATPERYSDAVVKHLPSGDYVLKAFGKDVFNRPTEVTNVKFKIDDDEPETKIAVEVNPEGLIVSFKVLGDGARATTFFKVGNEEFSRVSENEDIAVSWGRLRRNPNEIIQIEYYSENEFGLQETPKKFMVTQSNIAPLMWEDYSSLITPEMIWDNVLKHNGIALSDVNISFIGKGSTAGKPSQRVPDNVKGVSFDTRLFEVDVMYSEKYSLFFSGPPTEVLKVGQVYDFTFELITERSKERIVHTQPRAILHPVRSKVKDKPLTVTLVDGVFRSQFTVDESFLQNKYRLVISDLKNTHPPLREIPLTLSEDNGK